MLVLGYLIITITIKCVCLIKTNSDHQKNLGQQKVLLKWISAPKRIKYTRSRASKGARLCRERTRLTTAKYLGVFVEQGKGHMMILDAPCNFSFSLEGGSESLTQGMKDFYGQRCLMRGSDLRAAIERDKTSYRCCLVVK